ncbi:LuxR family transcriptional regulator AbsR2 [Streptomyces sp. SLBN-115]|uniref:LuxR family transcriptional regulator AbsR2 n=1 Tax=Streptomyces sp. SLBN-115 TaxID=2768453 RepID=UPI00114F8428|nr:LuxR C-terminal-related transcriptional regulator [Streptomyces sp. SLBN-115]TQJ57112.1 regulatory LuxR family protein [Streptomyces sp. SLBN-115]
MPTPHDVTSFEPQDTTLRLPWPFTGRDEELALVRRSLAVGRPGMVITGPSGCGRTRLAMEAIRGTDCARVAGTPGTRDLPFAAFAHLLPEGVTLHRAVQLLSGIRQLLVDDAQLLDDASAALLHQLAVQGRTRLLVLVTDGTRPPGAVARLWTGELLPRLALEPLPREDTAPLLDAGAGGPLERLAANRLHRLCEGDLRLLRDLLDALREQGLLTRDADTDERTWRGRFPVTPALRERAAAVLARTCPDEREILDRLAFAEPLPPAADTLDLRILERLEADGLLDVGDDTTVRLAHPLHGPVLRAEAGRLRARRLTGRRGSTASALDAEAAELTRRIERADVRTTPTPVGEWVVAEGEPVPARYAAVRARFSRLRGELREAAAWAREGLAAAPQDRACRTELALAAAQSGATGAPIELLAEQPGTAAWPPAARGDLDTALKTLETAATGTGTDAPGTGTADPGEVSDPCNASDSCNASGPYNARDPYIAYDAVRLGDPRHAVRLLPSDGCLARHARALADGDGPALDLVAAELEERGFLLFAAEAYAQAVRVHRDAGAARTARTRAVALARRCQGARTPALSGLVLGELTARQRQIVTLAAAGLSNRQIAERLTLSVRTVGNHLYGAYTRLGAGDRGALPWLVEQPA